MSEVFNTPYEIVELPKEKDMSNSIFSESPFLATIENERGVAHLKLVAEDIRRKKTKIGETIHTTFSLWCEVLEHKTDYAGEDRRINKAIWVHYNPSGLSSVGGLYMPPLLPPIRGYKTNKAVP